MNAVMITVLIGTRTGRAQKQLEVQTSMRAFSHQYYKLLPHTPSRSLTLSTLLCFVIPLFWSAKLLQDIFLCFILPVCQVQHALWHLRLLLCVSCPGKHPTDEKQSAVGHIWDKHWRRDVSICSDTLTSDDLSVCQSFISQKSIQSILQQPTLDCGQGWTQTKYTGACRRRREGSGRRKRRAEKSRTASWGEGNWQETVIWSVSLCDGNAHSCCYCWNLFGRTTTGVCLWSLSSARSNHVCMCTRVHLIMHGHICCIVCECQRFGACVYQGKDC